MPVVYTIGFTKKSLEQFIGSLRAAGVVWIIDVRLRNTSQLAGWSKYPDFAYLLREGFGLDYEHQPEFAPTDELLDRYKKDKDWQNYERDFNCLLEARNPVDAARSILSKPAACLLCTEPTADKCHRRLVAEYLASIADDGVAIKHL
jgi:uncharacterized protein (DUF488 family)